MDEPRQASQLPDIPNTPLKRWVKFLADLLPTIGFFGVFLLFGRDRRWVSLSIGALQSYRPAYPEMDEILDRYRFRLCSTDVRAW